MDKDGIDLVQAKLRDFFSSYPTRIYQKGDVLIQAGDKPPAYYITKGVILQYDIARNGDKLIVNMYKPGAFISLASILSDIPSDLFFEAAEHVNAQIAPSADVVTFLKDNPDVTYDALTRISRGGNGLMLRLARAMEGSAEGRILQELTIMQARFQSRDGAIVITETELAAQTGMARETISRVLKKLAAKELIKTSHGKIMINNKRYI